MITKTNQLKGEVVPTRPSAFWSDTAPRNLTPGRLSNLLAGLDAGDVTDAMALFDEMEEKDLHLGSVMQTRAMAAAAQDRDVQPVSGSPEDVRIADFVRERFDALPRRNALLSGLMSAVSHGFAIAEIIWETVDGAIIPVDIRPRPQKYFSFIDPDDASNLLDFRFIWSRTT